MDYFFCEFSDELPRRPFLGTGVKIDLGLPHFYPPVVARGAMATGVKIALATALFS
jgi:hypothetical protein